MEALRVVGRVSAVLVAALLFASCEAPSRPGGSRPADGASGADANDVAMRAIAGLETYAKQGCAACHCNDAQGGCNLDAPPLQGMSIARLDTMLRGTQQAAGHPMKMASATDDDIENLKVFLGTLDGSTPLQGDSLITQGYGLYISGTCISCHLPSGQGINQGGVGPAIAGTDPDNIYNALAGGVPCHPVQRSYPNVDEVCSLTGSYVTDNATVAALSDTAPPDTDEERLKLSYFLMFVSPPPATGFVEECRNTPGTICTVAGNGVSGFTDDGVPATESLLYTPQNVELTDWNGDGVLDLAIDDWNNHRIRMVYIDAETEGVRDRITSIAGTGKVTGSDALNHPLDIQFDPNLDGALVIAGWHNQNIYRYARGLENGADRQQLAGLCDLQCTPEADQPSRVGDTFLALPGSLALHPDGRIFIFENGCGRLRVLRVGDEVVRHQPTGCITPINARPDGTLETMAGELGVRGYRGDGGLASDALFNFSDAPVVVNLGIDLGDDNRIYIADSFNHCIRAIDLNVEPPTIDLVAGVPETAGYQDGPARGGALFNFPNNVYAAPDGSVYVTETNNHTVRKIDPDGNVTTVAGTGEAGFNGDNVPAAQAQLSTPGGVVVHPDGRIFISDTNNNRVRVIIP